MSNIKNRILYLAFGDRYINQAIFSIVTLINVYGRKAAAFKIIVLTDKPAAFSWLSQIYPVETVNISQAQLNEWNGFNTHIMRRKIKAIQMILDSPDTNLLYLDTDTFFLKKVDDLFDAIGKGASIMHLKEWPLSLGRKKHPELCPQDLEFDLKFDRQVALNDQTLMWNAGVIGVSSVQKNEVRAVLELNDIFYKINPSWHVEQLSFSVILSQAGKLKAAKKNIFHYWHNKEVADKYIKDLQFVQPEQVQRVLEKVKRDKRIMVLLMLYKFKRLKLREYIRSLPGAYRLYLLIKPLLKRSPIFF